MEGDGGVGDGTEDLLDLFHGLGDFDEHHQIQVEGPGIEGVQVHQGLAGNELPMERAPHQFRHLEERKRIERGAVDGASELGMHADHRLALGDRSKRSGSACLTDPGQNRRHLEHTRGGGRHWSSGDWGRLLAPLEGFEVLEQLGGIGVLGLALLPDLDANVVHKHLEQVHGLEEQLHDPIAELHAALAQVVQHVLAHVGHREDLRESQEACGPLDGMDAAEDGVQEVKVSRGLLKGEKVGLDLFEVLLGLDEEVLIEAGVVQGEITHGSPVRLAALRRPWRFWSWPVSVSVRSC